MAGTREIEEDDDISLEYPSRVGAVMITGIDRQAEGQKGRASEVLKAMTDWADTNNKQLVLMPAASGDLKKDNLIDWYSRNGDDDGCDGFTDEDEDTNESADYLLVVDYSGSMSGVIDSVANALCEWSMQGILQTSRFAVIGIGYTRNGSYRQIEKLTDFTDSATACDVLRRNNQAVYSGGLEFQLDAIYNGNEQGDSLYVNWQNSNKKVIVFSDEEMQEDMFESIQDGIDVISQQCYESGYSVSAFINFNVPNQSQWVDLTQNCGGVS